jgi:hypothetical protein
LTYSGWTTGAPGSKTSNDKRLTTKRHGGDNSIAGFSYFSQW